MLTWEEFSKVDMRTGTVIQAETFPEARNPAFKLWIDFGALGIKKTSAQITHYYSIESLIGQQIIAVVNFPPKQIGPFMSECLVLGVINPSGDIVLLQTEHTTQNGLKIG